MKNIYNVLLGVCLCAASTAHAGVWIDSLVVAKSNPQLLQQLEDNGGTTGLRSAAAVSGQTVPVSVRCTDAEAVAGQLRRAGAEAVAVTSGLVVAHLTPAMVAQAATWDEVQELIGAHTAQPYMDESVRTTKVDLVQTGEGLETPFTGKDVIMAVIDRGFEYAHPAFSTNNGVLRISEAWNHAKGGTHKTDAEEILSEANDGSNMMHATHVASIAAGTKVEGTPYGGMAPDAEIVMVSSSLNLNTVLEEVKYLKDYAAKAGKPCVVNMSFGTQGNTHDGLSTIYQGMDEQLGQGMIAVQSIGNNGHLNQHASKVIGSESDSLAVLVKLPTGTFTLCAFGEEPTTEKLAVSCYIYNKVENAIRNLTPTQVGLLRAASQIESGSGKAYAELSCSTPASLGLTEDEYLLVAWKNAVAGMRYHTCITGLERGELVAAEEGQTLPEGVTLGDGLYGANPAGRRILLIGSYDNKKRYTLLDGSNRGSSMLNPGNISFFSNSGPTAGEWLPMPLVCAPGGLVISAYSKQQNGFSEEACKDLSMKITKDGEPFYYGMQMGTSMSSPAVAGIIACWMQAYPQLTPEQATEIIAATAQNDDFTGDARNAWHPRWGYGKIDAYEGLKACLRLSGWTGVNDTHETEQPVTLRKERDRWTVLMNSSEPFVDVRLTTLDGRTLKTMSCGRKDCGDEIVVGLDDVPAGVCLLTVRTARSVTTRKVSR